MTEKVFWENPYQCELESVITSIDGNNVELSSTIFYAESGGQESDTGMIGGIPVLSALKEGKRIIYTLESAPQFGVGDRVITQIDWPRRYALMKLHFAAEVILVLLMQRCDHISKIGAHISESKSRIDFAWDESLAPLLADVSLEAQALLDSDSAIISDFSEPLTERRFWQVDGFAKVPCGGSHLRRTSEVGMIRLKRKNIGKGKERVEIMLEASM